MKEYIVDGSAVPELALATAAKMLFISALTDAPLALATA